MKFEKKDPLLYISISCSILLVLLIVLSIIGKIRDWNAFNVIFENAYVSGIIVTALMIPIIFELQIVISKRRIVKDFRCKEIIDDLNFILKDYIDLFKNNVIPKNSLDFCEQNWKKINIIQNCLTSPYNDILIDSLKICMFFNLNFNLMRILNNLKNRKDYFCHNNQKLLCYFEEDRQESENVTLKVNRHDADIFITDLRFLAQYWCDLLMYLNAESRKIDEKYDLLFEEPYLKAIEEAKKLCENLDSNEGLNDKIQE